MIKKIIKIVIISSIFSFFSTSLLAANVYKVRGKNVILLDKNRELKAGESYQLVDSAEKVRGKIKVLKVKGQKVFAKVISGQARKNFRTQYQDDFSSGFNDSSTVKGDKALRGYFGFVMGSDADSMPFVFGGDYLMPFQKNINLKMGGLYWFYSESGIDVSLLELSGGAYYYHSLSNKMLLEGGARLGISMFSAADTSKTYLTLLPFFGATYKLNNKMSVGGEWRYPFFLSDVDFDGFYFMAMFEYKL